MRLRRRRLGGQRRPGRPRWRRSRASASPSGLDSVYLLIVHVACCPGSWSRFGFGSGSRSDRNRVRFPVRSRVRFPVRFWVRVAEIRRPGRGLRGVGRAVRPRASIPRASPAVPSLARPVAAAAAAAGWFRRRGWFRWSGWSRGGTWLRSGCWLGADHPVAGRRRVGQLRPAGRRDRALAAARRRVQQRGRAGERRRRCRRPGGGGGSWGGAGAVWVRGCGRPGRRGRPVRGRRRRPVRRRPG